MMERKARKSAVLVAVFALVGMIGIFAVSQAYGDDNTNLQASNENAYSAVPMTFSLEDLFNQMQETNNAIANGNVNTSSNAVSSVSDDSIEEEVDRIIEEYEQSNPGKKVTDTGRQQLIQLFKIEETKPRNPNAPSGSSSVIFSNRNTLSSDTQYLSNNNSTSASGGTGGSDPFSGYWQPVVSETLENTANAVTYEPVSTPAPPAPVVTSEPEPVIQNIETPVTPESTQPTPEQLVQQQSQQPITQPSEINMNQESHVVEPLISKAIEDNVAAAATVTNTEPVIVEKEPTRGAGLFGEDGIIAQIVSNPVLRAGIAAFPILIIILIAGFMISRRNEE